MLVTDLFMLIMYVVFAIGAVRFIALQLRKDRSSGFSVVTGMFCFIAGCASCFGALQGPTDQHSGYLTAMSLAFGFLYIGSRNRDKTAPVTPAQGYD